MSSLPPVPIGGNGDMHDAINAALSSSTVFQDLETLDSFKIDNFKDPTPLDNLSFYPEAAYTTPGSIGDTVVGSHNLFLTDANSDLTITPGDRSGIGDARAVVVAGGNSTITFANDTVSPSFGYDIVSGEGTNSYNLNNGPDLFQSTTGNDSVTSGGGKDTIFGGTGSDTINAGGQSAITAGSANDTVNAFTGALNTITGGTGNLSVTVGGTNTNDSIFGTAGHDVSVDASAFGNYDPNNIGGDAAGDTVLHFSGGKTLEVKNVTITFDHGKTSTNF